jgi:hypothetical protein
MLNVFFMLSAAQTLGLPTAPAALTAAPHTSPASTLFDPIPHPHLNKQKERKKEKKLSV